MKLIDICMSNPDSISKDFLFEEYKYLDTKKVTSNLFSPPEIFNERRKLPSRASRLVFDRDILYSTVRPEQQHHGIVRNPPPNLLVSTGFTVLRVYPEKANAYYLYSLITKREAARRLELIANTSVSSYPSIKPSDIENLNIELPHIDIQNKIGNMLEIIEHKINMNREIINKIESQIQVLFDYWFTDFNFPTLDMGGYRKSGGTFTEEKGEAVPNGWSVKTVEEACNLIMGQSPPSSSYNITQEGLPFYQGVVDFGFKYPSVSKWCTKPSRIAAAGDVLLSVRAPVGRLNVASEECCIGRGVSSVSLPETKNYYTFYELNRRVNRLIKQGSGTVFDSIKKEDIQGLSFLSPPIDIIHLFEEKIDPLQQKIKALEMNISLMENYKSLQIRKLIR